MADTKLSAALRELRQREGISVPELSRRSNLSEMTVQGIESGRRLPSWPHVKSLLEALAAGPEDVKRIRRLHQAALDDRDAAPAPFVVNGGNVTIHASGSPGTGGSDPVPQFGRPDPLRVSTPADFVEALNAVHIWAGKVSLRKLETASGGVLRRSTISDMLNSPKVPDLDRCTAFLRLCGIRNLDDWVFTWRRLKALERPRAAVWLPGATVP
ncbi:helix-turn-helix domain-containing protein [Streptomyces sp. NPDC058646]|uniref:helix-turn-helix domain-containing protein n=1 Tax=Streptomyces sp. NPDC058646 TaxID=3346574 RepID=UPI003648A487